ncbi:MAG: geranylgeranylglyceryl/heptaprenylglyceryl phosphate synthase [Flaviramulus sp.]|nr:geranylgeranylglyceryl/heptaprenylglyceryl phosphate synthase [Flaviramulus sp.]
MNTIYQNIKLSVSQSEKLLAILIDPDKFSIDRAKTFFEKVNASIATHIFVGGSIVEAHKTDILVKEIKTHTQLPIVLFPGDVSQISNEANALLFLSLLSGRNAEFLIGKHVEAISKLNKTNLEIISTGYILIESGQKTAVEKVTQTKPISRNDLQQIVHTAKAAEFLGMKLIYLEAGSGALIPISEEIITSVKAETKIPLIIGGGIKSILDLENAYHAGADLVVIGNAFENNESLFNELKK